MDMRRDRAALAAAQPRPIDTLPWIGGEEFAVLAPSVSDQHHHHQRNGHRRRAVHHDDGTDLQALLARADAPMYRSGQHRPATGLPRGVAR